MGRKHTIYILLTHSGSLPSKFIGLYTKEPYSHVSIALDPYLNEMYSFGRLRPRNPILGGFVEEDIVYGTFGRFPKTSCAVYSLTINDIQYKRLKRELGIFRANKSKYGYNFLGILGVMIGIPIERGNNYFCSQFVAAVLRNSGIYIFNKPPALVSPKDFRTCRELTIIYEGKLSDYRLHLESFGGILSPSV